jgi:ATP-dependent RNA helicase DeaD
LICNAGGVSKAEIGAIKVFDRDTRFEIAADRAEQFALAVRTNKNKQGHISRVGARVGGDVAGTAEAPMAATAAEAVANPLEVHTTAPAEPQKPRKASWRKRDAPKPEACPPREFGDKRFSDKKRPRDDYGARAHPNRKGPDPEYLAKRKHRAPVSD